MEGSGGLIGGRGGASKSGTRRPKDKEGLASPPEWLTHAPIIITIVDLPSDPTSAYTSTHRNLTKKKDIASQASDGGSIKLLHTEAVHWVARAPPALPELFLRGAMCVRSMLVPDLAEKLDAIRAGEERRSNRMHGRVAPALFFKIF